MLERGDSPQVAFAQAVLAMDPDPAAASAAMAAAALRELRRNSGFVCNIVGAVRSRELAAAMGEPLTAALGSDDPALRRLALGALGAHGPALDARRAAELATDPMYTVALDAVEVLRLLGTPEAGAALAAALPRVHATARPFALTVIGMLRAPGAEEVLRAALREARGAGIAAGTPAPGDSAGEGGDPALLGNVGTPTAVGASLGLAHLGVEEGLEGVRAWVRSLPLTMPPGTCEDLLSARGEPWLLDRLEEQVVAGPADSAAPAIPLLLRYRGNERAAAAVATAYERLDWELLLEAISFFHALDPEDGLRRALRELTSVEQDRRYAAALALGRFRDPRSVEPLCRRLREDPSGAVRTKIADALGLLGDVRAAPALVEHLRSDPAPTPDAAWQAYSGRANLRGALAVEAAPLLAALLDRGLPPAVASHALRALGSARGAPAARPCLERRLRDAVPENRRSAALALGDLGDGAARPALEERFLAEPDPGVAEAIADAVLRIDVLP